MAKFNVLGYFDYCCNTGFGQVSKNIIHQLNETNKYNFNIVGINYDGSHYDHNTWIGEVDPATNFLRQETDVYGRQVLLRKLSTEPVDILYIIQDTFIVSTIIDKILEIRSKLPKERQFVIIYYFPIDGKPKKEWISDVALKVDFPITYTKFAQDECYNAIGKEFPLDIIYHGVNKDNFYYRTDRNVVDEFKAKNFPEHKDDFFVLNVNRNQPRKDMFRSMLAFKKFHEKVENSFLFINAQNSDVGGDLTEIGANCGLELYKDFSFPATNGFNANQGLPIEILNMFYNVADLVVSSTLGEGWGLSSVESMATKTPVLFPNNTSLTEIIGENEERGYLCKSGKDDDHHVCLGAIDNNILRPTIDITDMADKMLYIYNNYDEAMKKAEAAYIWVKDWKSVCKQWLQVFKSAENKLKEIRK